MDVRPNDTYKTVVNRFAIAFLFHVANKHQSELISFNNRIPVIIIVTITTLVIGYLEKLVTTIKTPGLMLVSTFLNNVFVFWGTFNAYILIAVTEFIFVDTLSGNQLTLTNLFRPILLILMISCILAVFEYFSKDMDKKLEEKKNT